LPSPLPAQNLTELGRRLRSGDLELSPVSIIRQPVELFRLEGTTGEERESPDTLVLTLRLTNRSDSRTLSPLDPVFVRDSSAADDQSVIETADGQRISMFPLAAESEWSIQGQVFPKLKPGETAETIIVSRPISTAQLRGPMTWHIKLRTRTHQTDVLGIRFSHHEVVNQNQ
jgi:hypothetical protein